ncbi:competence type IV pilus assembly protein ComGB [Pediococcus claussenii]|uniref:Type II secretory pathway/competence component n=1 Tax=Pediococcus claussenii (strain ATCC BAA-344 / DSM 14800 / JCM 18046 / KCTC 3811 / LMG 21948 / P06) TaxID=701521 RepID=G8PCQ3_PEDCP|nr:competence type IV pilus assembly protein ComGB [Pediococcus claussenii]AEV95038.1 Type II secretory pathway/competence component [Pediococcus claussenii ATCC BAA-344]ANZ70227.1 hypothetical protein AYR57_07780 [Pediococcus claussenii]ANZ72043.1 hypothetical protein AYR58_07780 [Pediococcus claussenii]KRN19160.1 hypothetical protein IV79_GL001532 [Pediococcus claussenii]
MKLLKKYSKNLSSANRLTIQQQSFLFTTLSDLLDMGFSIKKSLEFIQIMQKQNQEIINKIIARLNKGCDFANAIRPFISKDVFYQVHIASKHGEVISTVRTLGSVFSERQANRKKIMTLLHYPIMLLVFLIVMLIGMKILLFPELNSMGQTETVLQEKLLRAMLAVLVILICSLIILKIKKFRGKSIEYRINILCKLPIVGKIIQTYCHYYISFNLAFLVAGGLTMTKIVDYFEHFDKDSLLHQVGKNIHMALSKGGKIEDVIEKTSYLPTELNLIFNKGGTIKTISDELKTFSKIKYQNLTKQLEHLITLIQPIMFGVLGLIIVLMYLSILMPMYGSMKGIMK